MAASLLGYWPGEWTSPSGPISPSLKDQSPHGHSRQSSGHANTLVNRDNLGYDHSILYDVYPFGDGIYDIMTPPQTPPWTKPGDLSSADASNQEASLSYSICMDDIDWRTHQPPPELLNIPPGTAMEVESIIEPSLDRLQYMLTEKESIRQELIARREQEARKGKDRMILVPGDSSYEGTELDVVSIHKLGYPDGSSDDKLRPYNRSEISMNKPEGPASHEQSESSHSIACPNTASPRDSGNTSRSSERLSRIGNIFGLRSALRRSKILGISTTKAQASPLPMTRECVSCLDDFGPKYMVQLNCHSYCKLCFQTFISTALSSEDHWPPKCCLTEIPKESVLPHLNMTMRRKYKDTLEERSVPASDRIYCSRASCTSWIPPKNISKAILCAICQSCRQKTCTSCRGIYHASGECPQDPTLQATLQLANDEGWRRCYSCNAVVEHNQGCIHMTCKCKAQFCYVCGLRWRTCSCTDDQLEAIQQAAFTRRADAQRVAEEARARERASEAEVEAAAEAAEVEAAELREMLEVIEKFEMKEALRLVREAEELRLAAVASKQLQQEERVMVISKRYFDLRENLEFLHTMQTVNMVERYEAETKKIRMNEKVRDAMKARHAIELELAETESLAKISDSQYAFDQAYQARSSKEQEIEDKYAKELSAYWESRPGGAAEVTKAIEALRVTHGESYDEWSTTEREKHQRVVDRVQEEVECVKHQLELELSAMAEKISNAQKEIRRVEFTDAKWMKAVAGVRMDMLMAMEEDEYSREEEWL